jgi:hypothetical protein
MCVTKGSNALRAASALEALARAVGRRGPGEECFGAVTEGLCHEGLRCVLGSNCIWDYGLDYCCLPAGDLGQNCISGGGPEQFCNGELHCVSGNCECNECGIFLMPRSHLNFLWYMMRR